MSDFTTANQAARLLADGFEAQTGQRPSITGPKVTKLVEMGLFENINPSGSRVLLSQDQVLNLIENTTYIPDYEDFGIDVPVFRVSVVEEQLNPVFDVTGEPLRTYSGFDYANRNDLSEEEQRGGYEGAWSVSDENSDFLVEEEAYLVATAKGFVRPDCVRKIVGYSLIDSSPRKYFHTEPLDEDDPFYADIDKGFWIDVPAGRESNIDYLPDTYLAEEEEPAPVGAEAEEDVAASEGPDSYTLDDLIRLKIEQIKALDDLIARKEAEEDQDV